MSESIPTLHKITTKVILPKSRYLNVVPDYIQDCVSRLEGIRDEIEFHTDEINVKEQLREMEAALVDLRGQLQESFEEVRS